MTVKELLDRYTTLDKIKKGGQKTVFKATKADGTVVALKIIQNAKDPRVLQEIDLVRKLALENVPQILESGLVYDEAAAEEILYIEEEFIDGESLRDWLNNKNTFDLELAIRVLEFLLSIEIVLEKQQILHRDINPNNILLGSNGQLYLIDFGLARNLAGTSITNTGAQFGPCTPGYAPGEQITNQRLSQDVRTDLFQIGVTVYEGCTGKNPFIEEGNYLKTLVRTISLVPSKLTIEGDGNGMLGQFISMLMAKNQSQRPDTAEQALRYLDAIKTIMKQEE